MSFPSRASWSELMLNCVFSFSGLRQFQTIDGESLAPGVGDANTIGDTADALPRPASVAGPGLTFDLTARGLGISSQRYAMVVDNGIVRKLNIETETSKVDASSAETLLINL